MNVPPFITRALASWTAWRIKTRLYRIAPILRLIDVQEREARIAKKAVRPFQRQRQAVIADLLRKGAHHG